MFEALVLWHIESVYYGVLTILGVGGLILLLTLACVLWRYADTLEE